MDGDGCTGCICGIVRLRGFEGVLFYMRGECPRFVGGGSRLQAGGALGFRIRRVVLCLLLTKDGGRGRGRCVGGGLRHCFPVVEAEGRVLGRLHSGSRL